MKSEQEIREVFERTYGLLERFATLVDTGAIHPLWEEHQYPKDMMKIASILKWALDEVPAEAPEGFNTLERHIERFEEAITELVARTSQARGRGRRG